MTVFFLEIQTQAGFSKREGVNMSTPTRGAPVVGWAMSGPPTLFVLCSLYVILNLTLLHDKNYLAHFTVANSINRCLYSVV